MNKNKITQRRLFFDIEKENEYISEMNRLGWKLERVKLGWIYEFSKTGREEYTTVIFAEEGSKVKETEALAKRCGFEPIPHRFDGLKNVLYLCGRRDEVSPVFHNDSESLLRAHKLVKNKFITLGIICAVILAVLVFELTVFFIIPAASSGKSPSEYPLFFGLTAVFSVLTLFFAVLTVIFFRAAAGANGRLNRLKQKEAEKERRRLAKKDKPDAGRAVIHQRRAGAVDLTKQEQPQDAEKTEEKDK